MSKKTKEERIKTLKATQEARKQETLDKVNKAIERLLKTGAKISFQAIAREANVSVPYLYKYPELKERIQQLRSQQRKMPSHQVNQPPINAKTHSQMVGRLKKRIQQLEEENKELKRKNEALAGQVYRVHTLQEQVERQKDLIMTLESRLKEPPKAEVIPITSKAKPQVNEQIKTQLDELGIPLNTTLTKTIKGASEDTVLAAIEAVKYQLETREVDNPGGLLNKAIQEGWTKPEPNSVPSPPKPKIYHPTDDEEKKKLSSKDLAKLSNLFKDK
ncbi:hypothetical protein cce_4564 [Crocosphaera subtropica ATCC 51142]|uniref:Tn554-related, transposase C n=1 Tax=Crocosphaera subtropica (strain ATCC 51142 / BH68) TaxID=43989 RepID=B1WVC2_CROS5|nr:DUF6262 family protein [Crocosphaera subtropica]ACB53912.1 hypothetical protein cce_4564 [Crocosphaera subtropica ATCC 51142]